MHLHCTIWYLDFFWRDWRDSTASRALVLHSADSHLFLLPFYGHSCPLNSTLLRFLITCEVEDTSYVANIFYTNFLICEYLVHILFTHHLFLFYVYVNAHFSY